MGTILLIGARSTDIQFIEWPILWLILEVWIEIVIIAAKIPVV